MSKILLYGGLILWITLLVLIILSMPSDSPTSTRYWEKTDEDDRA